MSRREERYEPDQPHGVGGEFTNVTQKRPGHGGPESGHPVKPGQPQGPPRLVPTKSEFGPGKSPSDDEGDGQTVQQQKVQQPPLPPGLDPGQEQAVEAWLGPDQPDINVEAASGNAGPYAKVIDALESAILQAPALDNDQIVYRGLPQGQDLTKILKPHTVLSSPGFTPCSTTALPVMVRSIELTVPRGSKALELPGELLLPRGARIRIDEVPSNGNVAATYLGPGAARPKATGRSVPEETLARYRSLWFRSTSREERQAILEAVRALQGQ